VKIIIRTLMLTAVLIYIVLSLGCSSQAEKPSVEPPPPPPPVKAEPTIEDLRKHVDKDPEMFKVFRAIEKYGTFKKKYMTYEKFKELTGDQTGGAINPDWFYDSYSMPISENKHWVTLTFGTSNRAKAKDPRIQQVLTGLPENSITIKMQTPDGKKYLLSDAEADGILDYAALEGQKTPKIDIPMLDAMQVKYTWLLGILKGSYKKMNNKL